MSKTPSKVKQKFEIVRTYHHCHVVGHIRPNFPKLRSLSTSKVRPPSRKPSSSKTTNICHHRSASSHTQSNYFKLFPHKRVSNRSHLFSKGFIPILGELLKTLSFLPRFHGNPNSSMSFSRQTWTHAFSSSGPKTRVVRIIKDPKT